MFRTSRRAVLRLLAAGLALVWGWPAVAAFAPVEGHAPPVTVVAARHAGDRSGLRSSLQRSTPAPLPHRLRLRAGSRRQGREWMPGATAVLDASYTGRRWGAGIRGHQPRDRGPIAYLSAATSPLAAPRAPPRPA